MTDQPAKSFTAVEVDEATKPPRARVDQAVEETPVESAAEKLERKRDYLEGFLAQKPVGVAPGEPGGALYEQVIEALKDIYDPEIPVNIVDLGLIYDLSTEPVGEGDRRKVTVQMTLTAPGCGMGPALAADARQRVSALPGVAEAEVSLVWDPPWGPERISPEGRVKLGID